MLKKCLLNSIRNTYIAEISSEGSLEALKMIL